MPPFFPLAFLRRISVFPGVSCESRGPLLNAYLFRALPPLANEHALRTPLTWRGNVPGASRSLWSLASPVEDIHSLYNYVVSVACLALYPQISF